MFQTICSLFESDLGNPANYYYGVMAKYTPWTDESSPDAFNSTYDQGEFTFRQELILGKKIDSLDTSFLVSRNTWTIGTVYDQYDDDDPDLFSKAFYVINGNDDVFKCLNNNYGAPSTEEPISKTTDTFELSDGYKWKYMFSVSSSSMGRFSSSSLIPVDSNTTVSSAAVHGTVDTITVTSGGSTFNRFATGNLQSSANNGTLFRLSNDNSGVDSFYTGLMFYVNAGTGDGAYARVAKHFANTSGIYVVLSSNLTLDFTTNYVIYPEIVINGNGRGAKAYCVVNTTTKSITAVHVTAPGNNYTTAAVYANTVGADADLRAIISPVTGHGYDGVSELGADKFIVVSSVNGDENGSISSSLAFRKYGVLKNPKVANGAAFTGITFDATIRMNVSTVSSVSTPVPGELITGQTSGAVAILASANSTYIVGTAYTGAFANGESILTSNSQTSATITAINSPQINAYSGELLFYDVAAPIARSNTSVEDIGFILTNLSENQ